MTLILARRAPRLVCSYTFNFWNSCKSLWKPSLKRLLSCSSSLCRWRWWWLSFSREWSSFVLSVTWQRQIGFRGRSSCWEAWCPEWSTKRQSRYSSSTIVASNADGTYRQRLHRGSTSLTSIWVTYQVWPSCQQTSWTKRSFNSIAENILIWNEATQVHRLRTNRSGIQPNWLHVGAVGR